MLTMYSTDAVMFCALMLANMKQVKKRLSCGFVMFTAFLEITTYL